VTGISSIWSSQLRSHRVRLHVNSGVTVFGGALRFWRNVQGAAMLYAFLVFALVSLTPTRPAVVNRGLDLALSVKGQREMRLDWKYTYLPGQSGLCALFWFVNAMTSCMWHLKGSITKGCTSRPFTSIQSPGGTSIAFHQEPSTTRSSLSS